MEGRFFDSVPMAWKGTNSSQMIKSTVPVGAKREENQMANHSNGSFEEGLGKLLEFILNMDRDSLRERANQLKEQHPDETSEQLAHRVIGRDRWWDT